MPIVALTVFDFVEPFVVPFAVLCGVLGVELEGYILLYMRAS